MAALELAHAEAAVSLRWTGRRSLSLDRASHLYDSARELEGGAA